MVFHTPISGIFRLTIPGFNLLAFFFDTTSGVGACVVEQSKHKIDASGRLFFKYGG
jgi:hypothetical protein